jgi:hypothetical protein
MSCFSDFQLIMNSCLILLWFFFFFLWCRRQVLYMPRLPVWFLQYVLTFTILHSHQCVKELDVENVGCKICGVSLGRVFRRKEGLVTWLKW